ncbi:MAG: nuclear transport factor 2 family protein, partial [Myxococcota bacterium]
MNELVVGYLAAWNERDAKKRRAIIANTWTDDGTYVDAHRNGVGHEGIDKAIATAQASFPGYRLHLVSGIEAQNGFVRFSWAAGGSPEAPLYLGGTDFAVVGDDGRLASVAG